MRDPLTMVAQCCGDMLQSLRCGQLIESTRGTGESVMASTAMELRISDLPKRQASALRRKAERMGLSTDEYVKQLIEDDLALDLKAQATPLEELAAPFRKALKGASEEDLAQIVAKARSRRRR
jgi:hypothetical protein